MEALWGILLAELLAVAVRFAVVRLLAWIGEPSAPRVPLAFLEVA